MKSYLECWIDTATALFSQALAGEPALEEAAAAELEPGSFTFEAILGGERVGQFAVIVDHGVVDFPLLGEGVDQKSSWGELLREVAESAAGELLVQSGRKCRIEKWRETPAPEATGSDASTSRSFVLKGPERSWRLVVLDQTRPGLPAQAPSASESVPTPSASLPPVPGISADRAGLELLMDVELEATLRFGCRELPLGQVLDLGPGDVVQLDRTVNDPVDLVVGDKIVARGEVVLVNGNFGLRVTEVATPRKRLESIRCLF